MDNEYEEINEREKRAQKRLLDTEIAYALAVSSIGMGISGMVGLPYLGYLMLDSEQNLSDKQHEADD